MRPKVALIGPVLPFRGGISQHTTRLRRTLARMADVRAYSFSRQYPRMLFPGESDRDPAFEGHAEPDTSYSLDSVDPSTWRSTVREVLEWGPDAAVMPWWTIYFGPCFAHVAGRLRRAGVPVVFMCHNVTEHESAAWKRLLTRRVLSHGSAFVVQTRVDEQHLRDLLGDVDVRLHLHPVYDQFPPPRGTMPPEHALELLFFGFVRPYKGLDLLIEAMALVPRDLDVRLTVAGEFWEGSAKTRERIAELGITDRVDVLDRYITEEEAAECFGRAHAVALPYRSATGSGVVAVAYHYGKPVVVTDVGGLPDVVLDGETGLVVAPESPEALAAAIERLAVSDLAAMGAAVERHKRENMSWGGLASTILEAAGLSGGAAPVASGVDWPGRAGGERRDAGHA